MLRLVIDKRIFHSRANVRPAIRAQPGHLRAQLNESVLGGDDRQAVVHRVAQLDRIDPREPADETVVNFMVEEDGP